MQIIFRVSIYCLIVLPMLAAISCQSERSQNLDAITPSSLAQSSFTASPTKSTTKVPIASELPPTSRVIVPSQTPTPSPVPTNAPTKTPTLTPYPSWTPFPTLNAEERADTLKTLYETNGGCDLPCWWGIELGDSTEHVIQTLQRLDVYLTVRDDDSVYIQIIEPTIRNGNQISQGYLFTDNLLSSIDVGAFDFPPYRVERLMTQFGLPSEIWLSTYQNEHAGIHPAFFIIHYPDAGMTLSYSTEVREAGDFVQICFDLYNSMDIWIWEPAIVNPEGSQSVKEINKGNNMFNPELHKPIEEISDWDIALFYDVVTDPTDNRCLETPLEHWPIAP